MLHSSFVPVAAPSSFVIGLVAYWLSFRFGLGETTSVAIATKLAGVSNLAIGIPKNLVMLDIPSLLIARPISLLLVILREPLKIRFFAPQGPHA